MVLQNNKDYYKALELDLVLALVADKCSFSVAKERILNSEINFNPLAIKRNMAETKEALMILKDHDRFHFDDVLDIGPLLNNLKRGYTLTANELLTVLTHNFATKRVLRYFRDIELEYLVDYLDSLFYSDHLIAIIQKRIDHNGEIKDDASEHLTELRNQLRDTMTRIDQKAREFIQHHQTSLQENVVYYRNDRACFLVKNSDKNKYDGFSYGNSASGQASYVEPRSLIDLNNRKVALEHEIEEEKRRILYYLSLETLKDADRFLSNLSSLAVLDAVFAKADYGLEFEAVIPVLGDDLYLKDAAHPLISKAKVVYNTYRIIKPKRAIVISGSNTGGKTVSLKVIGLSVLLTYLGIPIIAQAATIPLYDAVYHDIDDAQSLVDSLSTFSSRLKSLNYILNRATDRSLVLIDEIASGTDPKEGEALALAIIDKLGLIGSTFVVTTHFDQVKQYALKQEFILPSSQEFDYEKLLPTYRYLENSLGQSNALDIAQRYIDDQELIKQAKVNLSANESEEEINIRLLAKERDELNKEKQQLDAIYAKQKELLDEYEQKLAKFKAEENEMRKEAKDKLDHYLDKQKQKARQILKRLSEEGQKAHAVNQGIAKIDELSLTVNKTADSGSYKVNDLVKIISYGQIGKLIELDKDQAKIEVNGMIIKTKTDDIEFYQNAKTVKTKKAHIERSFKRPAKEIVLVGMRSEEALRVLGKYLDNCYGANMKTVKIVTGIGTGALKKAVWDYLSHLKTVKDYHYADYYDGGSAATVVEFK